MNPHARCRTDYTQIVDIPIRRNRGRPFERRAVLSRALTLAQMCNSSALRVWHAGRVVFDETWSLDSPGDAYAMMRMGETPAGEPVEDVGSLQKSLIALLVAIARGRNLLQNETPVTELLGSGWSRSPESEAQVRIHHLLSMTSGLDAALGFEAPPGEVWRYNTAAYSQLIPVLEAIAGEPIDAITQDWIASAIGMQHTHWIQREWANPDQANRIGLQTTASDLERLGRLVLTGGEWQGVGVVPGDELEACLRASQVLNPAFGELWWINGGERFLTPYPGFGGDGPYFPAAPPDTVAALGVLDRHLMVTPSLGLIVVRLGDAVEAERPIAGARFMRQLWRMVMRGLSEDNPNQ